MISYQYLRPLQTATVFNWVLKINGQPITDPFGGLNFSHTISGFGTNGVATGQFEFDLYDESGYYGMALLEGASAQLFEADNRMSPSREYYISNRSISHKVCHFVAYDRMSNTDQPFEVSGAGVPNDEGLYYCGNVMAAIAAQCGFSSMNPTGGGLDLIQFTLEQLQDRTCRDVMEMIAEAMCGVWICGNDNIAVLSCLGAPYDSLGASDSFTEIDYQGKQRITALMLTNSNTGMIAEYSTGEYGTALYVESPFVGGTELDSVVWERVKNYEYQAWRCDKALLDGFIPTSTRIDFDGASLLANNVSLAVDSTGIYFSGGCDPQDESQWGYDDYLKRKKLEADKLIGNAKITSTGRYVFINKNK